MLRYEDADATKFTQTVRQILNAPTVQIDNRVYDVLANVRKKPDGEFVYSIQLNKNKAPAPPVALAYDADDAASGYASERVLTNASSDSIRSSERKSQEKFSAARSCGGSEQAACCRLCTGFAIAAGKRYS